MGNIIVFAAFLQFFTVTHLNGVQVKGGNKTFIQGEDARLFCQIIETDEPLTQITWQKRTREEPVNHNFFIITPKDGPQYVNGLGDRVEFIGDTKDKIGSIRLKNIRLLDEGVYTCIFTMFPSGSFQTKISLTVLVPPVVNVMVQIPAVIGQNEVTLATCIASNASPPAEVSWLKGRLEGLVREVTNSTLNSNSTTTVHSHLIGVPTISTNGQKVQCVIKHTSLSEDKTLNYTIDVHYPPQLVTVSVNESSSQAPVFQCTVDANPAPTIYNWTRPGESFPALAVRAERDRLRFQMEASNLSGLYVCEASNPYGRSSGSLYVYQTPSGPRRYHLALGVVIIFIGCVAAGIFSIYYRNRESLSQDVPKQRSCSTSETKFEAIEMSPEESSPSNDEEEGESLERQEPIKPD